MGSYKGAASASLSFQTHSKILKLNMKREINLLKPKGDICKKELIEIFTPNCYVFYWSNFFFLELCISLPRFFSFEKRPRGCNPSLSGRPIVDLCHWDSAFILAVVHWPINTMLYICKPHSTRFSTITPNPIVPFHSAPYLIFIVI